MLALQIATHLPSVVVAQASHIIDVLAFHDKDYCRVDAMYCVVCAENFARQSVNAGPDLTAFFLGR